MQRLAAAGFALALCLAPCAADDAPARPNRVPAPLLDWQPGLSLLHASRTNRALEWFIERKEKRPKDACGFYFPALVYTNFDVEELTLEEQTARGRLLLEAGIEAGEQQLAAKRADAATRYCLGALYGLRAEDRLKSSKYLRAAFEGKKARRVMLDLVEDEPEFLDCRFWLGSYDYFADVLPSFIKFFRSLLFFPGGDKERGLAAMHEVAERGTLDRYNALWILFTTYASLENDEVRALQMLDRIRQVYPDNVQAMLTRAWYPAGKVPPDHGRTVELMREARTRVGLVHGQEDPHLVDLVELNLAQALDQNLEPAQAVEVARPLLERGAPERRMDAATVLVRALSHAGQQAQVGRVVQRMREEQPDSPRLARLVGRASTYDEGTSSLYARLLPARRLAREGRHAEARERLRKIGGDRGEHGLIYLLMAADSFDAGRYEEAERDYRRVIEIGGESPWFLLPEAHVRLGNIADLAGRRAEAKAEYRKAISTAGSRKEYESRARGYLKRPYARPGKG